MKFALKLIICVLVLTAWSFSAWALEATFIHTSDVHSHYDTSPRIAEFFKTVKQDTPNVFVIDTGDQSSKSPYFDLFGPNLVKFNIKILGYDMMALGNHEFDNGLQGLRELTVESEVPILCANMHFEGREDLQDYIHPYLIKEIGSTKIGFIGVVSNYYEKMDVGEPQEYIRLAVKELEALGVNKIVLLSHCGFLADLEFAENLDGIDVILGGHSHTLFSKEEPTAEINAYPMVINNGRQNVLLVHSGEYGKYVGKLTVEFDDAGYPIKWRGDSVLMSETLPVDAEVAALFEPYKEEVEAISNEVIGLTQVILDGREEVVRFKESNFGDLAAEALLAFGKKYGADMALVNGGNITDSLHVGEISRGLLERAFLYNNYLAIIEVTGSDLRAALENSVAAAHDINAPLTGRFLQVAGLRFEANLRKPVGMRVKNVYVQVGEGFVLLNNAATYKVITLGYIAKGNDNYTMLEKYERNFLNSKFIDVLTNYIQQNSPIIMQTDGRIKLIKN